MKRRAFTLIELLVVVAIIALLIALILPSIIKAKEQARKTVCLAHLKQIANAFFSYGGNNNSMVPDGGGVCMQINTTTGQVVVPSDTVNTSTWPEELVADGDVLQKYTNSVYLWAATSGIFYCPSANYTNPSLPTWTGSAGNKPEAIGGGATGAAQVGYGMGYYAGSIWYYSTNPHGAIPTDGSAAAPGYYTMKTNFWRPNGIVLCESDVGFNTSNVGPSAVSRYGVYTVRHMKGANYLLGDGHAEWNDYWNSSDLVNHPEATWSAASPAPPLGIGQPKDISVWGHNPCGRKGGMRP